MKETPMLFQEAMVGAILRNPPEDPKTQTRRSAKEFFTEVNGMGWCQTVHLHKDWGFVGTWDWKNPTTGEAAQIIIPRCRYGEVGDRIWVKETHWRWGKWMKNGLNAKGKPRWRFRAFNHDFGVRFTAPAPPPKRGKLGWHKRPSIFMPRLASRILLEIVKVRAERLQDISEKDAIAEGAPKPTGSIGHYPAPWATGKPGPITYVQTYEKLWKSINGVASWDANDFVWVIEFKRIKP